MSQNSQGNTSARVSRNTSGLLLLEKSPHYAKVGFVDGRWMENFESSMRKNETIYWNNIRAMEIFFRGKIVSTQSFLQSTIETIKQSWIYKKNTRYIEFSVKLFLLLCWVFLWLLLFQRNRSKYLVVKPSRLVCYCSSWC